MKGKGAREGEAGYQNQRPSNLWFILMSKFRENERLFWPLSCV